MHLALQAILEFHKKMKLTIGDPRNPDVKVDQALRLRLINEELEELQEALDNNDVAKVADGIGDLIYVLAGAAVAWGIDIASVFDEIHRSNMTKKAGNRRADGKILKDADYSPPDIQGVLDEVAANYDDGPDGWWEKPYREPQREPKHEIVLYDPPKKAVENIMAAAKEQAKVLAMKSIKVDFVPEGVRVALEGPCGGGGSSDGIPQGIKGELTAYGAFVFDCSCERRHAVQAKLGSRGGLADSAKAECICGKAYVVDFTKKEPTVTETTIEELRKDS